jgi:transcription termination factor Rho
MAKKKSIKETILGAFKSSAPESKEPTLKVSLNTMLLQNCKNAANDVVAVDFHDEVNEILDNVSDDVLQEFLDFYNQDKGNVCCLVLDKAKRDLVAKGTLVIKNTDAFGHPFML